MEVITTRAPTHPGVPTILLHLRFFTITNTSINTVYKAIKKAGPYIGETINLLKRHTAAEREAMQIVSLFPGASGRLLRAVEQVVLDYQKTLGSVSNQMKALDFQLAKNKGYYEKAVKFLEENYPNWKEIVATSH